MNKEIAIMDRIMQHNNAELFLPIRKKIIKFIMLYKGTKKNNEIICFKWIAEKCNIHPVFLSRIMNGHLKASPVTLIKLKSFIKTYCDYENN